MHSTIGRRGSSRSSPPSKHPFRINLRLGGDHVGNDISVDGAAQERSPHLVWVEAAGAVQADDDVDVRLEARGLAVAEMADVTLAERMAALKLGSITMVAVRNEGRRSGIVVVAGEDFLVLGGPQDVLLPAGAVSAISTLPHVLHDPSPKSHIGDRVPTWRSLLRELLGERMQIATSGIHYGGRLTWVGADHVSLESSMDSCSSVEVTLPWARVDAVMLPFGWRTAGATELP